MHAHIPGTEAIYMYACSHGFFRDLPVINQAESYKALTLLSLFLHYYFKWLIHALILLSNNVK